MPLRQHHFHLFPPLFIHVRTHSVHVFFLGPPLVSQGLALFHYFALHIFIPLSQTFVFRPIPSSSVHEVFLSNVARCTLTHSDARTPCIFAVWDYQNALNTTSRLSFRQLCVRTCVVLWLGVWCAQLRVIIWWLTRAGKTSGLWSSGHAARPQPANQRRVPEVSKVQRTYERALRYSVTRRPHQNLAK